MDKIVSTPLTCAMDCKLLKTRSGQRVSAVCVASLLIAANDFGHSTPMQGKLPVEQVVCITLDDTSYPRIQFSKGEVQHASDSGYEYQSHTTVPNHGDTIVTGPDGFVSLLLAEELYANVQPHSRATFDSSAECDARNSAEYKSIPLETPYLSAAIRG